MRAAITNAVKYFGQVVPVPKGTCPIRLKLVIMADLANHVQRLEEENASLREQLCKLSIFFSCLNGLGSMLCCVYLQRSRWMPSLLSLASRQHTWGGLWWQFRSPSPKCPPRPAPRSPSRRGDQWYNY